MASDNPMDRGTADAISPAKQDEITERAVLTQILVLHPDRLTILELSLRMEGDSESFAKKDAIERAVRELSRDGLLACRDKPS